jgi:cell division protein FtsQ
LVARSNSKKYYRKGNLKKRSDPVGQFGFYIKTVMGVALLIFLSLAFIMIHDLITQSNYFSAKNLFVTGNQRLSPAQILEHAQIEMGTNILAVNLSSVRKKLLAHPWIAEAAIRREIPDKIRISIQEHIPVAVVDLGPKYLMSDKGFLFKKKERSDPDHLPHIRGLRYSDIKIAGGDKQYRFEGNSHPAASGTKRPGDGQPELNPLNAVMEVLNLGQKTGSILKNDGIKQIRVDKNIGLTLYPTNIVREIRLGYHDFPQKYAVLRKVFNYIKNGKIKRFADFDSIDLNNLNRVVLVPMKNPKPRKGS